MREDVNNQRKLMNWLTDKPSRYSSKHDQREVFGGVNRGFTGKGGYRSSQWRNWNYAR